MRHGTLPGRKSGGAADKPARRKYLPDRRRVKVVFVGVSDVDSSALALLMEWRRTAADEGREPRFQAVPAAIREIAALSEVDRVLDLEA